MSNLLLTHVDATKSILVQRSQYIECILALKMLNARPMTKTDLQTYWDELPRSHSNTNLTNAFLQRFDWLIDAANLECLKFYYEATISDVSFKTEEQCNAYKLNKGFIFYLALKDFRGESIEDYLREKPYAISTVGPQGQPDNEYVYISKKQNFNNPANTSAYFYKIETGLGLIVQTDIIKLHYSKIANLLAIVKTI